MGRFFEVLRQDPASSPATPHTFSTDWAPSADKVAVLPHEAGDVPFIEVGPKKFLEASPGVLAAGRQKAPRDAEPILAVTSGDAAVALSAPPRRNDTRRPEPRRVVFREVSAPLPARLAPELVAFHAPDHPVCTQYRQLVQSMLVRTTVSGGRVLLATAARAEAGTTTTLLNLAISAARLGRNTLVVDANLRRPAVAERLGLPEAPGLREVLAGAVTLDEVVRSTAQPKLQAIAAGLRPAVACPRVPPDAVRSLWSCLREQFDAVFVDAPSWDGRAELVALGAACDAVYLVLPESEAETAEVDSLCQLIPEQGARLAGCILARY
jgi:Mrp family chromosome partitioning ATPase